MLLSDKFIHFGLTEDGEIPPEKVCPFIGKCRTPCDKGSDSHRPHRFSCALARLFCVANFLKDE